MGESNKEDEESKKTMDIDEVLPLIGEPSTFQVLVCLSYTLLTVTETSLILMPYFTQDTPAWRCISNSNICTLNGTYPLDSTNYTKRCAMPRTAWEFTREKEYSVVTQFDLHCDTELYSYLATSLFFISWAFGAIVLGWLADRFGRKTIALPSAFALIVLGFLSAFSPSIKWYLAARTLIGFFIPGNGAQLYVIVMEFASPKMRAFTGSVLMVSFAVGMIFIGIIAIYVQTWKMLTIYVTAPFLLVLISFVLIPESIRWLRIQGRTKEAMQILKRIANFNSKTLPEVELTEEEREPSRGLRHFIDLVRPKKIAIRNLIQGYAWIVNGLVYYGVAFAADDLGGDKYRDYILSSLLDFPAALLCLYFCSKFGRKKSTISPMLIAGISCIVVSLIPARDKSGSRTSYTALRIFLGMLGKLSITVSFDVIYIWSAEMYPTVIRSAGMGYLQICARIGSALAPWIALWLKSFHIVLPFSIMGGSAFICALMLLWLPETANKKTPEKIADQLQQLIMVTTKDEHEMEGVDNNEFSMAQQKKKG